jgi:hypothetical protein
MTEELYRSPEREAAEKMLAELSDDLGLSPAEKDKLRQILAVSHTIWERPPGQK